MHIECSLMKKIFLIGILVFFLGTIAIFILSSSSNQHILKVAQKSTVFEEEVIINVEDYIDFKEPNQKEEIYVLLYAAENQSLVLFMDSNMKKGEAFLLEESYNQIIVLGKQDLCVKGSLPVQCVDGFYLSSDTAKTFPLFQNDKQGRKIIGSWIGEDEEKEIIPSMISYIDDSNAIFFKKTEDTMYPHTKTLGVENPSDSLLSLVGYVISVPENSKIITTDNTTYSWIDFLILENWTLIQQ